MQFEATVMYSPYKCSMQQKSVQTGKKYLNMRFEVQLEFPDKQKLPFDNVYYLSSAIYERMSIIDADLSRHLHERRGFKHFTFSWIRIPHFRIIGNGIIPLSSDGYFLFTSPNSGVARTIAEGFLTKPTLKIGVCKASVKSVTPRDEPVFSASPQKFRCISPVILRTRKSVDDREIIWDLSPQEAQFKMFLARNLLKRYEDYHGKVPNTDHFEIGKIWSVKRCRLKIKDTYNRAHFMQFSVDSSPQLLQFAYQAGIGERNSLGFGMIEVD
jgi:CRISPR-associated endoribonuclease Cas6